MEELFVTTIPDGHVFYRGTDSKRHGTLTEYPMWVGDLKTARMYGPHIHMFRATRNLRLLDISNTMFHADFMARVNKLFKDNDENAATKARVLAPLGLPDFKTQMMFVRRLPGGIYDERVSTQMKHNIDKHVGFFGRKHRYSFEWANGVKLDHDMAVTMKRVYPNIDGYICEYMWPTYHHNGFFLPETCLFTPITCITYTRPNSHIGGSPALDVDDPIPNQFIDMGYTKWSDFARICPGKMDWNVGPDEPECKCGGSKGKKGKEKCRSAKRGSAS